MPDEDAGSRAEASQPPRAPRSAGRNLVAAIVSGVVLLAWIIATLVWWQWGFVIFLMACVVVGAFELVRALGRVGMYASYPPIAVGGPLAVALTFWLAGARGQLAGISALLGGLAAMIIACLLWRLRGPVAGYIRDVAGSLFVIAYLPLLLGTLSLLLAQPRGHVRVIVYFVLVVCLDTGAYAIGSLIGSHKMAPHISPGKTWEGLGAGVAITAAAGAIAVPLILGGTWWAGLIVGLLVAVAAVVGDLVESAIKRDAGLKDMGGIIPGHGGALDRLDSLLVAAPVAWLSMLALVS